MKLEAPQNSAFPPCPLALSLNLPCAFAPTAVALAADQPLMSQRTLGTVTLLPLPLTCCRLSLPSGHQHRAAALHPGSAPAYLEQARNHASVLSNL